jgi:hypothetical protein
VYAPFPKNQRKCVTFNYAFCTDTNGLFVLPILAQDPAIKDADLLFVDINNQCRLASYQGQNIPGGINAQFGAILGVGSCSAIGVTGVQPGSAQLCDRCNIGRRLSGLADEVFELQDGEQEYDTERMQACADYDYEGHLHVGDAHFFVVAVPGAVAKNAGCPAMAAHAVYESEDRVPIKQGLIWNDPEECQSHFEESLYIGTWRLETLLEAAEQAEHTRPGSYNIITNNCANFLLDIMRKLEVKINAKMTSYVTRRLLQNSPVVKGIREAYKEVFGSRNLRGEGDDMSDEDLIQLVVETRANEFL